jgi:hypothetical protein
MLKTFLKRVACLIRDINIINNDYIDIDMGVGYTPLWGL